MTPPCRSLAALGRRECLVTWSSVRHAQVGKRGVTAVGQSGLVMAFEVLGVERLAADLTASAGELEAPAAVAQVLVAHFVFHNQPDTVREGLAANPLYFGAGLAWFGAIGLIGLTSAWAGFKKPTTAAAGWVCALLGLLAAVGFTVVRDGIRDLTLSSHGFDVWQQAVVTNWPVVALFLALFVAGLATVGWLVSVMMRAKPVSEKVV